MSEPDTAPTTETHTEQVNDTPPQDSPEELSEVAKARLTKANKEAATLRARLKELEPLATEAMKAREAQKSDLDRLREQNEGLLAELAESNRAALRERVARQTGLPDELAELLRGDSEEEIAEHAKRLAVHLAPRQVRRPDPSQAAGSGDAAALNGDPLLRDLKTKLHIP